MKNVMGILIGAVFPVVMYGCESWTVKKAEHRRIDAFELWCWRRLLRVPWTVRRSNQSILKEISPGISLEGLMPKLKLLYFGHLMRRVDSLEKTLMLGGIGGRRKRGRQRMRWLDGITHSMDVLSDWTLGVGDGQGGLVCCDSCGRKESDTTERLNWTEGSRVLKTDVHQNPQIPDCWAHSHSFCFIKPWVGPENLYFNKFPGDTYTAGLMATSWEPQH